MFGVDFSELMIILLVALVVVGPERMPKVARTLGNLLGRAQRFVNTVKSDITRDMAVEDYRKLQQEIQEQASSLEQTLNESTQGLSQQVQDISNTIQQPATNDAPKQHVALDAGGGNVPARSVSAGAAAPRKPNLCAIVDKAIAAGGPLEESPDFQTLTSDEQENARKLHAQEEKLHGIRNNAHAEVERAKKLAALAEAKAQAKAQEQKKAQEQQDGPVPDGQVLSGNMQQAVLAETDGVSQGMPEQKKFLID